MPVENPGSPRLAVKNYHLLNKFSLPPILPSYPTGTASVPGPSSPNYFSSLFISLLALTPYLFFLRTKIMSCLFVFIYKWLY